MHLIGFINAGAAVASGTLCSRVSQRPQRNGDIEGQNVMIVSLAGRRNYDRVRRSRPNSLAVE